MGISLDEITTGSVLAGKYRVERLLGQGGMGVVVEARHITLDDRVALKFLLPEYAVYPDATARFLREARAAVKVKGPHVARVSDVGTLENGAPYMVMEYLEGTDASKLIANGALSVGEAIDFVVQASDAISEAHSLGIVHRDLKPANLFVTKHTDGTPFIKVLDFGISKMADGGGGVDGLTRTNATMGSALYMSPEQMRQAKSVDHRTDIYALGVTLYELLSRRHPFVADTFVALAVEIATGKPTPLLELRPDLPPELAAVIEKAFARDPAARHQSLAELVVALSPWAMPRSQTIIERIARFGGLVPAHVAPARPTLPEPQLQTIPASTDPTSSRTIPPRTRSLVLPIAFGIATLVALGVVGVVVLLPMMRPRAELVPSTSAAPPASTEPSARIPPSDAPPAAKKPNVTPAPAESVAAPAKPELQTTSTKPSRAAPKALPDKLEVSAVKPKVEASAKPAVSAVKTSTVYDKR